MQKVWALRKPILDAHMLSLQKKIQVLEQKVDEIVIEKVFAGNHYSIAKMKFVSQSNPF